MASEVPPLSEVGTGIIDSGKGINTPDAVGSLLRASPAFGSSLTRYATAAGFCFRISYAEPGYVM